MNRITVLALAIVILTGCSKNFTIFNVNPNKLNIEDLEYEYLSLRSKVKFNSDGKSVKATANVRIRSDSVIWFSLTPGLGIEAARGLISKDSIILLDKIHKKYSILRFKDLSEKFHFDLDFNIIESILLGKMIWPLESKDKVSKEETYYKIDKTKGDLSISHFVGMNTMKLEKLDASSDSTNNSLMINYKDFELISQTIFPLKSTIEIKYKQGNSDKFTNIALEHNKVEIDKKKLKFNFNIPSKYEPN